MAIFKNGKSEQNQIPYFGEFGRRIVGAENAEEMYNTYPTGRRNLVHNGSMIVNQKFEETTGIVNYNSTGATDDHKEGPDRHHLEFPSNRYQVTVRRGSSDPAPGFAHYFETELESASSSDPDGANDYIWFVHKMTGDDMTSLMYGNQQAMPTVLSFWVRSQHPGEYAVNVYAAGNPSATRIVTRSYTVTASNRWEKKFIRIPPNYETNCAGRGSSTAIWLQWGINNGASRTGGQQHSGWSSYVVADYMEGGRSNALNTAGDKWAITGIQWEAGEIPTPFEYRSYAEELLNCQRFLYRINSIGGASRIAVAGNYSNSNTYPTLFLPVPLNSAPTVIYSDLSAFRLENLTGGEVVPTSLSANTNGQAGSDIINNYTILATRSGNATQPINLLLRGTAGTDYFQLSSEL